MANWYWIQDGQKQGPADISQLQGMAQSGQLKPTDMIWRDGLGDWIPASNEPTLGFAAAAPKAAFDTKATFSAAKAKMTGMGGGSLIAKLPLIFSSLALLICVVLAFNSAFPLMGYSVGSPEGACEAMIEMRADGDVEAIAAYQSAIDEDVIEKAETFEIMDDKTKEYNEKVVLFVKFKKDGKTQRDCVVMEEDEDTGYWKPASYKTKREIGEKDKDLAKEMQKWASDDD